MPFPDRLRRLSGANCAPDASRQRAILISRLPDKEHIETAGRPGIGRSSVYHALSALPALAPLASRCRRARPGRMRNSPGEGCRCGG